MDQSTFAHPTYRSSRILRRPRLAISERRLLLITGDLLLIVSSVLGALLVWTQWTDRMLDWSLWGEQGFWAGFISTGWLLWLVLSDMYNLRRAFDISSTVQRIFCGGLVIALAYLIVFFVSSPAPILGSGPSILPRLTPTGLLPRLAPGIAIIATTAMLSVWRTSYAVALRGSAMRRRVLIVGAGKAGSALSTTILQDHRDHYDIVGFVDDDVDKQAGYVNTIPVLGGHELLTHLADQQRIDEIAIAISAHVEGSLFQAIMYCYEQGVAITPMPLLYERLTGKVPVEHIGSQWYVALPLQQHAASNFLTVVRRVVDIVFGLLVGLVFVLFAPFIALAIRLDSPGSIFYSQERAGLHGRPFTIRKFRSMIQDAEHAGQPQWATKDDHRITRTGRILRKTRLDELPQVLNVLRGDMSLVGPRPERPQFIEQLQQEIPFYRTRLAVKPGLTGWAQVNYGYGATVEDALVKLQYDLYYIKHQSPWLDLLVLLRTISVILRMKGQ
ncbi:MAG: sugar transferase [Chloroflexota bacterium]|nr:sugar transferase [Chloroflexota bacterium]